MSIGVLHRVWRPARSIDRERRPAELDDRVVDQCRAEATDALLRGIPRPDPRPQSPLQVDAHRIGHAKPDRAARQDLGDLDHDRNAERADRPVVRDVHVIRFDEHARLDEPDLDRKDVPVAAAAGVKEMRDAEPADDLANLLLAGHRLGTDRHRFVIGADQHPIGIVQPVDAELAQGLVEVDDVPVVHRHELRLRVDDVAGRNVTAGDPGQDLL